MNVCGRGVEVRGAWVVGCVVYGCVGVAVKAVGAVRGWYGCVLYVCCE